MFLISSRGRVMSIAVLDDHGRVVLPEQVTQALKLSEGDIVLFVKQAKDIVVKKCSSKTKRLEHIMDWNPERAGKIERVSPRMMKKIWQESQA